MSYILLHVSEQVHRAVAQLRKLLRDLAQECAYSKLGLQMDL